MNIIFDWFRDQEMGTEWCILLQLSFPDKKPLTEVCASVGSIEQVLYNNIFDSQLITRHPYEL